MTASPFPRRAGGSAPDRLRRSPPEYLCKDEAAETGA